MRRRSAITLIEVVIVIAILTLVVAIAYPIVGRARLSSLQSSCLSRQRQIYQSLLLYGNDNPGYDKVHPTVDMPAEPMRDPLRGLLPYLGSRATLHCPATPPCGRAVWGATYLFSVGPKWGSAIEGAAGPQHQVKFEGENLGRYPLIYTTIFDEIYYQPSERHISQATNPPFLTYVTADGSARKGGFPVIRVNFLAQACGGSIK